jgi:hypothetical protein
MPEDSSLSRRWPDHFGKRSCYTIRRAQRHRPPLRKGKTLEVTHQNEPVTGLTKRRQIATRTGRISIPSLAGLIVQQSLLSRGLWPLATNTFTSVNNHSALPRDRSSTASNSSQLMPCLVRTSTRIVVGAYRTLTSPCYSFLKQTRIAWITAPSICIVVISRGRKLSASREVRAHKGGKSLLISVSLPPPLKPTLSHSLLLSRSHSLTHARTHALSLSL